jgi:HAD superfamily hydrolase (TIGR01549 family)
MKKNSLKKYKIICFDLDGVIINSFKNMEIAWNKSCKKNNLDISFNSYQKFMGLPFYNILKGLNIKKNFMKIQKDYNYFSNSNLNKIKTYPGIKSLIKYILKNYIFCIITSKNKLRALKCLKNNNINYNLILCPNNKIKGKPSNESINYIKKKYKVNNKDIVYVGDSIHDYIFTKNSRIDFIHARWAHRNKIQSKYFCNLPKDLLKFI